jgi:hypothetical protein
MEFWSGNFFLINPYRPVFRKNKEPVGKTGRKTFENIPAGKNPVPEKLQIYKKMIVPLFRQPYPRRRLASTNSIAATAIPPIAAKGVSGDFAVVGHGVGTVVAAVFAGFTYVDAAVGAAVGADVGATTVKLFWPIYPLASVKSTV